MGWISRPNRPENPSLYPYFSLHLFFLCKTKRKPKGIADRPLRIRDLHSCTDIPGTSGEAPSLFLSFDRRLSLYPGVQARQDLAASFLRYPVVQHPRHRISGHDPDRPGISDGDVLPGLQENWQASQGWEICAGDD